MSEIQLVLLRCPDCQQSLQGDPEQILVNCSDCSKYFELVDGELQERPAIWFLPKDASSSPQYAPAWRFEVTVEVRNRQATGGGVSAFFGKLFGSDEGLGRADFTMFVPAWELPLPALRQLCLALTQAEPQRFRPGNPERMPTLNERAMRPQAEAEKALHFIYLTMEAERPDMLITIDFDLDIHSRHLTLIPVRLGTSVEVLL